MSRLSNKVALVTGASKGIGGGIATALGAAGARVAVNYSSDREGAERVAQTITGNGGDAIAVGADVSKAADAARLFKEVHAAFGRLDVLVNNAGVFRFGAFAEITEESFHLHYNINVLGAILTVQEAIKRFGPDGGSIINLSSIVGSHPVVGALLYASTKGAIETLTKGVALELAPRKIRVNAIAPGHTETEGNGAAGTFEGGAGAVLAAKTPLGRLGRFSDIAPLAVFLASDESAWITGESFGPRAASLWPLECDVLTAETEKAGPNMDVQRSTALRRSDGLSAIASLRHHWPEYLMEVGELGLYLFVACVVATLLDHPASIVRQSISSGVARRALMGLVMGATAIAIVISRWGKRSGGHFNPAITFTFYRLGKVEFWDTWFYVIAQFLGAMSGVALAKYMLRGALAHDAVRYAVTVPGMFGSTVAFVAELTISFF